MSGILKKFKEELDKASAKEINEPKRGHLGPSQVGTKCMRVPWMDFRHITDHQPEGRMARLFNRGHEEEHRVIKWLRGVGGIEVRDYTERLMYHDNSDCYATVPWETDDWGGDLIDVSESPVDIQAAIARGTPLKQWGFSAFGGHFSGSSDGKITGMDRFVPDCIGWGGWECKTSADKYFKPLADKGVHKAKPEHVVQMNLYMHFLKTKWTLYTAVNKNDDHIHAEIVYYDESIANRYVDRALGIIASRTPPKKLTEDPTYWQCKSCEHIDQCHYGQPPEIVNCRTCIYSDALPTGEWHCHKYGSDIPLDFVLKGCKTWESIL